MEAGYQRQRAPPFTEAVLRAQVDLWDADAEAATDAAGYLRQLMRRTALLCCYRAVARGVDSLRERWEGVRVNAHGCALTFVWDKAARGKGHRAKETTKIICIERQSELRYCAVRSLEILHERCRQLGQTTDGWVFPRELGSAGDGGGHQQSQALYQAMQRLHSRLPAQMQEQSWSLQSMRRGGHQADLQELAANQAGIAAMAGKGRWAGLRSMLPYSEPNAGDAQRAFGQGGGAAAGADEEASTRIATPKRGIT